MDPIPQPNQSNILINVCGPWAVSNHSAVAYLSLDGDQDVTLSESCPREFGIVMQLQNSFISTEVEVKVSEMLRGQEKDFTNHEVVA